LLPRSSNSLATPLVTTRSTVSCLVISNSPFATMRSESFSILLLPPPNLDVLDLANSSVMLLSHRVVSVSSCFSFTAWFNLIIECSVPHIAPELLPTKTGKGKKESQEA
jgi:hypothetical protein